jgi:hypothetical protein
MTKPLTQNIQENGFLDLLLAADHLAYRLLVCE